MLRRVAVDCQARRFTLAIGKRYLSSAPSERDVVIVGGGPAGLALASALGETVVPVDGSVLTSI